MEHKKNMYDIGSLQWPTKHQSLCTDKKQNNFINRAISQKK